MSVPGSNILKQALTLIASQTFEYVALSSVSAPNAIGMNVNTYEAPVNVQGSVQPVPRTLYQQYGLNFDKNYVTVYIPQSVVDIDRNTSSDQIVFNSLTYQILSNTRWFPIDGWVAFIAVQVS